MAQTRASKSKTESAKAAPTSTEKKTTAKKKAPVKKAVKAVAKKKAPIKKAVKAVSTYDELMKLAKEYGVDDNAMFIAAAKQYDIQLKVIDLIRKEIEEGDTDLIESKEYVKGSPNAYASPLIKELPKHSDSANRTLGTMLDIITKLGKRVEEESGLSKFEKEFS